MSFLWGFFFVVNAWAVGNLEFRQHQLEQNRLWNTASFEDALDYAATAEATYDQKLDHFNPSDTRTFRQRYFVNSTHAAGPDAPVLYVICGEGACAYGGFLGAPMEHARKLRARLVSIEHRYYGESRPFPQLTKETLAYLSTEQALADLAGFQESIARQNGWTGKWVALGGSYAGTLAAYYRLRHPEKVVGALASSAPVEAKAAFADYDAQVTRDVGPECAANIRSVVQQVEDSFADPQRLAAMKDLFGGTEIRNNVDFIYTLADMAAIAVQYGRKEQFCAELRGSNPLEGYANVGREMLAMFGLTPLEDSFQGAERTDAVRYAGSVGIRQWIWQTCTEYGFFQVANPNPALSVRSAQITLPFHFAMCRQLFGLARDLDTAPKNRDYYEPLLGRDKVGSASHIYFTNGASDPWQFLSITRERGNALNPALNYRTIAGAAHCDDLGAGGSVAVREAKDEFARLVSSWLAESASSH